MNLSKSDKTALGLFIAICIILWFCVQTGGHYDFILHLADKEAHKELQEKLQGQITSQKETKDSEIKALKEEINPLKDQIEILRIQVNQLNPQ